LTITLNRPDKLNVLNADLFDELADIFTKAGSDDAIQGVLITGNGKAFSAGADINQLAELNAKTGLEFARKGQSIFRLLEQLGKPSLAAVNGFAFGGGCELAISATMRIAAEKAIFCQPEVKLGVIPGYGGTQRLARLIGKGRALDLCLTGRSIKADEALSFGLVSEVVSPEKLLSRAEEILAGILTMAPIAVRSAMEVIHAGYDLSLEEALRLEAAHFGLLCATDDKHEGITAFLAKRPACFEGK
jgi:enoyl-CoA hydratase